MRKLLVSVAAAALVLGIAPGAGAQPPPTLTPAIACDPIETHVGSTFSISLVSNRATGYSWALEDPLNRAIVAYRSKRYVAQATHAMGAPGLEIWTFTAVGRGKMLISFKYARPWEKTTPPAKEALYVAVVR